MNPPVVARTELSKFLEENRAQIVAALPKHLNAERMCRLALTAFSQNKALQDCSLNTIFASVVIAAQLGLEIGVAGQGFLVPYKGKCTFVPGWQGLVDLVSRSGRATVWTGAVYEGDDFDWALGDRPFVKHKPRRKGQGGDPLHTYAVGRAKGSEWPVIEVWDDESLVDHRDKYNKVGEKHYSYGNWEMYARKVPLLQVIKYLPKSIELANAIALEGAYAEGKGVTLEGDVVHVEEEPADTNGAGVHGARERTAETKSEGKQADLLSDGAKKTLQEQMRRAGRSETDIEVAGFGKVAEIRFDRFNEVMDWLKKNPAKS